jgi:hypothetical protein
MNGQFTYSSGSTTGYAATFDEIVAATDLDITQAGDISFKKLASASTVTITTSYSTKITSVDMGAMTSVTSIDSGANGAEVANTLTVSSATNVDLGALTRYGSSLSITTKKDATLDIASLDDKTATGTQSDISLTLNGPASVTLSNIDDGTITLSNVAAATVSGFYGTLDINSGVETLTTTDSVTIDLDGATDLVTGTLDYKYDWDPTLTTAQAAVADDLSNVGYLENYDGTASIGGTDLKTLTISGEIIDLYLDEANLETLTLTGVTMHNLTISNMDDLTSLSVATGNKIGNISLTGSDNLTVANFDHTTNLDKEAAGTTASTAVYKAVDFVVTNNLALTKLHTTGDNVDIFTVTGNDALTELDMTGLLDQGTQTSATVNLWDNNLTATKANNTVDSDASITAGTDDDGESGDLGSFDDGTSGMDTMKVYLTAIAADADNTVYAGFDTVSSEDDTETSGTTTTTLNILGPTATPTASNESTVLRMVPSSVTTAAVADNAAVAQKMGWYVDQGATGGTISVIINGATIPAYTLTGNDAYDAAQFASATNVAAADTAGAILAAKVGAFSGSTVSLVLNPQAAATVGGEKYSTNAALTAASTTTLGGGVPLWSVGLDELFTLTVGSNTVTTSLASGSTALNDITVAVLAAWAAKYGNSGTASAAAIATLTNSSGVITVDMLQDDSAGYGKAVSFGVTAATTDSRTGGNIDWVIGATKSTGDNTTVQNANDGLIVTVTSKEAGSDLNTLSAVTTATDGVKATMVAFTTNYTANATWAPGTLTTGISVERTDVANVEEFVGGSAAVSSTAVSVSRVTWLG